MSFLKEIFQKLGFNDNISKDEVKLYEEETNVATTTCVPPIRESNIQEVKKVQSTKYSRQIRRVAAREVKKAFDVFFQSVQKLKSPGIKNNLEEYQKLLESRVNKHLFKLDEFDQQTLRISINQLKQVRKPAEISSDLQKKIIGEIDQILSKY